MATSPQISASGEALFLPDRTALCSSVDISALFSDGVLTRCDHRDDWQDELTPQEKFQIGDVCEKRYAEFAAGRSQARQLIAVLTGVAQPVLIGDKRQPLWPEAILGSISHSDHYCAVAVTTADSLSGIGIDVEPFEELDADVAEVVLTESELEAVASFDERFEQHGTQARGAKAHKLIFSIKEAVYKCCYAQVQAFIDFKQCEVTLDTPACSYQAIISCHNSNGEKVQLHINGRWLIDSGYIFASAELA